MTKKHFNPFKYKRFLSLFSIFLCCFYLANVDQSDFRKARALNEKIKTWISNNTSDNTQLISDREEEKDAVVSEINKEPSIQIKDNIEKEGLSKKRVFRQGHIYPN